MEYGGAADEQQGIGLFADVIVETQAFEFLRQRRTVRVAFFVESFDVAFQRFGFETVIS